MAKDPKISTTDTKIEHQAAAWLAKRDRGMTAAEQDQFFQWLALDPRHGEWLVRHQQTLKSLKLLAQWKPEHGLVPNPNLLASPAAAELSTSSKIVRWFLPVSIAAAGILLVLFLHKNVQQVSVNDSDMAPIVRRVLEDGSTIDLNRGAQVEVAYTPQRRDITLICGEAIFTVAKNPNRPFIVKAGGVEVRAVGTAFNVNFRSKAVEVLVTEGKVRVSHSNLVSAHDNTAALSTVMIPVLEAGHRVVVSLPNPNIIPKVDSVSPQQISLMVAWQPKQLEFSDTPLAQVVAEFNARNKTKMIVDDPRLASIPVGASLRSDNIEGFVRILEASFHIKAEHRPDGVIMLRPASL